MNRDHRQVAMIQCRASAIEQELHLMEYGLHALHLFPYPIHRFWCIVSGASFTLSNSSFAIATIWAEMVMRPTTNPAIDSGSLIA